MHQGSESNAISIICMYVRTVHTCGRIDNKADFDFLTLDIIWTINVDPNKDARPLTNPCSFCLLLQVICSDVGVLCVYWDGVCVCVVWDRERVVEMLIALSDPGCFPALSWPLISELSLKQKEWHRAYSPVTWDPRLDAQLPPYALLGHKNNSPQSQPHTLSKLSTADAHRLHLSHSRKRLAVLQLCVYSKRILIWAFRNLL